MAPKRKPSELAAHTEALHLNTAALTAHAHSMNNLAATLKAVPILQCGTVKRDVKPLRAEKIRDYVLEVAGPTFGRQTPDKTKINPEIRSGPGDQTWFFAQECTKQRRFHADGLIFNQLYVLHNCKTLGDLVKCVQCCYQHPGLAG
jgi:hypothetical protein